MRGGKRMLGWAAAGLAALATGAGAGLAPVDILRRADEARGNLGGVRWEVNVTAVEAGRTNSRTIDVQARAFDVNATTLAPARSKGHILLMLKGNMWFYKPDLSKPVPVSQRQKLLGKAANGDIASTNYAEDYDVIGKDTEAVHGEDCYRFDLLARTKNTTYHRVQYWISKARLVGVKADYYTVSGKVFKSAAMEYDNRVRFGDEERPFISKMTINDELTSHDTTTLRFSEPVLKEMPQSVFDLNLLGK